MSHLCPKAGCGIQVPDQYLMCRQDWYSVPMSLRKKVLETWNGGRGIRDPEYWAARQAAIDHVNGK